jgi:hypothetical protein
MGGDPDSSAPPDSTFSLSLEDLYLRLTTGATGTATAFTEPTTAPGTGTMYTIDEIMAAAPEPDNTSGAGPGDVLAGKTFWGVRTDGTWGLQTGTLDPTLDSDGDGVPDFIDLCPNSLHIGDLCWSPILYPENQRHCMQISSLDNLTSYGCYQSKGASGATGCDASDPLCFGY